MSAYQEGRFAYYDGLSVDSNPFEENTEDFNEWEAGWYDAEFDNLDWPDSGYYEEDEEVEDEEETG